MGLSLILSLTILQLILGLTVKDPLSGAKVYEIRQRVYWADPQSLSALTNGAELSSAIQWSLTATENTATV